jgi:hypothetical protein
MSLAAARQQCNIRPPRENNVADNARLRGNHGNLIPF